MLIQPCCEESKESFGEESNSGSKLSNRQQDDDQAEDEGDQATQHEGHRAEALGSFGRHNQSQQHDSFRAEALGSSGTSGQT